MNEPFQLKIIDKFSGVFKKLGYDYDVVRKILKIKLIMDKRNVPTVMQNQNKKEKKDGNNFKSQMIMYLLFGLFTGLILIADIPLYISMNMILGITIFIIALSMMSDFSSVLLDIKDKNILLPKPIKSKDLNLAKVLHITIYLITLSICFTGVTMVIGTIKHGIFFLLIFILIMPLLVGFIIFLTSLMYLLILHFYDGEKLKDIINYCQIILTTVMVIFYQLSGRVFDFVEIINLDYNPKLWHYILPSMWFSAPFELFLGKNSNSSFTIFTILLVVISVISLILYLKVISPYFEKNLQKLNNNSSKKASLRKGKRQRALVNILCRDKIERAFLNFDLNMLNSERKIKLTIYPNIALGLILPISLLATQILKKESFNELIEAGKSSKVYLYVYITIGLLSTIISLMWFSEKYEGAWIYKVAPIKSPKPIIKGIFKAIILKYILPLFVVITVVFALILGVNIIPHMIIAFINYILIMIVVYKCDEKLQMPFSEKSQTVGSGKNFLTLVIVMAITAVLAFIHYKASSVNYGIMIYTITIIAITYLLGKNAVNVKWNYIKNNQIKDL
ncbi:MULTISPECIES: hypothetical protein [Clostridium]|uniref:ABC transporter permease n=1 Tax=Clostridium faecium TaxID=2762223 RepID=A0ABR8YT77_9CLOT|nr:MULTISPECIES: hypothetical protein [Clostridium]MBD8047213.1 hypothetical protein [Clostridium faecium]